MWRRTRGTEPSDAAQLGVSQCIVQLFLQAGPPNKARAFRFSRCFLRPYAFGGGRLSLASWLDTYRPPPRGLKGTYSGLPLGTGSKGSCQEPPVKRITVEKAPGWGRVTGKWPSSIMRGGPPLVARHSRRGRARMLGPRCRWFCEPCSQSYRPAAASLNDLLATTASANCFQTSTFSGRSSSRRMIP